MKLFSKKTKRALIAALLFSNVSEEPCSSYPQNYKTSLRTKNPLNAELSFATSFESTILTNDVLSKQGENEDHQPEKTEPTFKRFLDKDHKEAEVGKSDFAEDRFKNTFIDKTMLIDEIFRDSHQSIAITAPRRFGKSTNLDMIKRFCTLEVDASGNPLFKGPLTDSITGTPNFRFFEDTAISSEEAMKQHFGKYPVIYIHAEIREDISAEVVWTTCVQMTQNAYVSHSYVCSSSKLSTDQQKTCKKWLSDENDLYEPLYRQRTLSGLSTLAEYLYLHFDRKCVVLVDEYDAITTEFLTSKDETVEAKAMRPYFEMMNDLIKVKGTNIQKALFTGISQIAASSNSKLNNVHTYPFHENHRYSKFYGFLDEEFNYLMDKFQVDSMLKQEAIFYYDGYSYANQKRFNPLSVVEFLSRGEVQRYWTPTGFVDALKWFYKNDQVMSDVEKLLRKEPVIFFMKSVLRTDDVIELRNFRKKPELADANIIDMFFSILVEQGYLVATEIPEIRIGNDEIAVRIPNREIEMIFRQQLAYSWSGKYEIRVGMLKQCDQYISRIDFEDPDSVNENLLNFSIKFQEIMNSIKLSPHRSHLCEKLVDNILYIALNPLEKSVLTGAFVRRRLHQKGSPFISDVIQISGNNAIIFELKQVRTSEDSPHGVVDEELQQIVVKGYHTILDEEEFVPGRLKSLKLVLFVGLNVDDDYVVTCGYKVIEKPSRMESALKNMPKTVYLNIPKPENPREPVTTQPQPWKEKKKKKNVIVA